MNTPSISMRALPFVPWDPTWVLENRAFLSGDARLVRAVPKLLMYAWHAEPAASIPGDMQRIGALCGLTDAEVGQHFDDLLEGWAMRDGRYFHVAMAALSERIAAKFGDVLENLADQAAAVVQAPEEFELTPPVVESRTKGRRLLPKDFGLTTELRAWLQANGFEGEADFNFIMEKFKTHAQKDSQKANNWDAAFKNFALKENKRYLPSRQGDRVVPLATAAGFGGRAARWGAGAPYGSAARGEEAVNHNRDMLRGGSSGG